MRFRIVLPLFFSLPFWMTGDGRMPDEERMISTENLKGHVEKINFERSPDDGYPGLEQAAQYIEKEFVKVGLDVKEDHFQWQGKFYRNIVADKTGRTFPNRVLILGAHYDTVSGSPGADDNASAVSVLLEVARAIQAIPLKYTVRFIAFSLEEYDFAGSAQYVSSLKKGEEEIFGMISLEMVGFTGPKQNYPSYINPKFYPNVGDFIAIIGNERSKQLLEKVCSAFKTRVPELPSEFLIVPGNGEGMEDARLSDHSTFWDHGFQALMITDTAFLRNPNYHLPSDRVETLDFEFMRKVATGVFYSIMELAG
jgi:aminopeptidase YwaD